MRFYFVVAAAGVGKRMNLDYPKQFLEYKGKPLFINVLEKADKIKEITDIIIVTNKEYIEEVCHLCKKNDIKKVKKIIAGGKERYNSIYNALEIIEENESFTAIQDGVRPFFKEEYIIKSIEILKNEDKIDGVVTGVKVKDTIKIIDENGIVKETPDRDKIIAAHTPQVFRTCILKRAYKKAIENGIYGTDDSSFVERDGGCIKFLNGDYSNIKITTPEDIDLMKVFRV